MLADDTVSRLTKAVRALKQESHKYTGFVRFSISEDNTLTSIIEPKNSVLPLLAPHFCDRYPNESFLIYDKTHSQALVWHNRQKMIIPLDGFEQPQAGTRSCISARCGSISMIQSPSRRGIIPDAA